MLAATPAVRRIAGAIILIAGPFAFGALFRYQPMVFAAVFVAAVMGGYPIHWAIRRSRFRWLAALGLYALLAGGVVGYFWDGLGLPRPQVAQAL